MLRVTFVFTHCFTCHYILIQHLFGCQPQLTVVCTASVHNIEVVQSKERGGIIYLVSGDKNYKDWDWDKKELSMIS